VWPSRQEIVNSENERKIIISSTLVYHHRNESSILVRQTTWPVFILVLVVEWWIHSQPLCFNGIVKQMLAYSRSRIEIG
jgi:P2-related tail formation protein